jgi:hypothetical protein
VKNGGRVRGPRSDQPKKREWSMKGDHNFVFKSLPACSFRALAWSRMNLRKSFPLGFFGMLSTNSTPPARCLYATLASETCYRLNGLDQHQKILHMSSDPTLHIAFLTSSIPWGPVVTSCLALELGTTKAIGTSPLNSSGTPTTQTSETYGWSNK